MGGISIVLYVIMNFVSAGTVIADSVSALGVMIAFYYGLTGFSCVWYYRNTLGNDARTLWMRGILPLIGGIILWFVMVWSIYHDWNPVNSYTSWTMQFPPHWHIGGVFLIDVGTLVLGIVLMLVYAQVRPAYFRGEVLNKSTKTLVPATSVPKWVCSESAKTMMHRCRRRESRRTITRSMGGRPGRTARPDVGV